MATGSEATSEALVKHLRASGDAPPGKRFGWGDEWETPHLVNFVVSAVGAQPSDGPSVVAAVRRSHYRTSPGAGADQSPRMGPGTLHEALVHLVDDFTHLLAQRVVGEGLDLWSVEADIAVRPAAYDPKRAAPDHLTFHFSPFSVEVEWIGRSGHEGRLEVYAPLITDETALSVCRRWHQSAILHTATIPSTVLLTAAKARLEASTGRGGRAARRLSSTEGDDHDD